MYLFSKLIIIIKKKLVGSYKHTTRCVLLLCVAVAKVANFLTDFKKKRKFSSLLIFNSIKCILPVEY